MKISKTTVLEFLGEFLATMIFAFVLFVAPMLAGGIEPFVIAFLFMAIWYVFSPIAKVHMNPVVSLGEYLTVFVDQIVSKKFIVGDLLKFLGYIVTQLLAFFAAFPLANWVRNEVIGFQIEKNAYTDSPEIRQSFITSFSFSNSYTANFASLTFVLEMIIAFLVVFTFIRISTSEKYKQYTGFVWGLVIFSVLILASQITGASFNPWRSLVPAIIEGKEALAQVGLYILAPICGAVIAGLLHSFLEWMGQSGRTKGTVSRVVKATSTVKRKVATKGKK